MSGAWVALFVVLWLVVVLLVILVTGLIRRINDLEAREPHAAGRERLGPKAGYQPPAVRGHDRLVEIAEGLRGRIVLFLGSSSDRSTAVTRALLQHLHDQTGDPEADLVLVLEGGGIDGLTELQAAAPVVEDGRELALAWEIPGTPFAVLIDCDGLVRMGTFVQDAADVLSLARLLPGEAQLSAYAPRVW